MAAGFRKTVGAENKIKKNSYYEAVLHFALANLAILLLLLLLGFGLFTNCPTREHRHAPPSTVIELPSQKYTGADALIQPVKL